MKRRQVLVAVGAIAAAGCASGDGSGGGGEPAPADDLTATATPTATAAPTPTPVPGTISEHSAVQFVSATGYTESYTYGIEGVVENVGDHVLDYVEVEVYYYDASDVRIGEGLDNTTDLPPGGRWRFKAPYLGRDPENIESWVAIGDASVY